MNVLAFSLASAVLQTEGDAGILGALFGGTMMIVWLVFMVLIIAGMWKMFVKAGQPGWAAFIPLYNLYVLLQIAGRPGWWFLLFLVPFVNIVVGVLLWVDIAKAFGRGAGFALGLLFLTPIFILILGFGEDTYLGPLAATGG